MPLHLLGKKSWNVYNADNVARVKKDEADQAAHEAAAEQHMQEEDAERRLKLLRGESVSPVRSSEFKPDEPKRERREGDEKPRKRRRINGEDDTERELRYAQEDLGARSSKDDTKTLKRKSIDAPLVDAKGNINLFPIEAPKRSHKNAEVEAEKKRKERELEDQYTMRFSNAAGFKEKIGEKPWYHTLGQEVEDAEEPVGKNVWGREDPGRRERDQRKVAADDPLAMITQGVAGVRQVEKERKQWMTEKEKEIRELEEDERRQRRRRKKARERDGHRLHHRHRSGSRQRHRSRDKERSHRHRDGERRKKSKHNE